MKSIVQEDWYRGRVRVPYKTSLRYRWRRLQPKWIPRDHWYKLWKKHLVFLIVRSYSEELKREEHQTWTKQLTSMGNGEMGRLSNQTMITEAQTYLGLEGEAGANRSSHQPRNGDIGSSLIHALISFQFPCTSSPLIKMILDDCTRFGVHGSSNGEHFDPTDATTWITSFHRWSNERGEEIPVH